MKSKLSEFSYGYALTEELSRYNSLIAAPYLPSLRNEGNTGGYDVRIEYLAGPLFLQFKLSEKLITRKAKEFQVCGLLKPPFYRFRLRPLRHSCQHDLLLDTESQWPRSVYYSAPAFVDEKELNQKYLNSQVVDHSVFVSPAEIGSLNLDEHYISFKDHNSTTGYLFSEYPAEKKIVQGKTGIRNAINFSQEQELPDNWIIELKNAIMSTLKKKRLIDNAAEKEINSKLEENAVMIIEYAARVFMGAQFFYILKK